MCIISIRLNSLEEVEFGSPALRVGLTCTMLKAGAVYKLVTCKQILFHS